MEVPLAPLTSGVVVVQHVLRRGGVLRVVLATDDVIGALYRVAAQPRAALDVAVLVADVGDHCAEDGEVPSEAGPECILRRGGGVAPDEVPEDVERHG